jgi:hypothetical protein
MSAGLPAPSTRSEGLPSRPNRANIFAMLDASGPNATFKQQRITAKTSSAMFSVDMGAATSLRHRPET